MSTEIDRIIAEALGTVEMVPSMTSDDGHEVYPVYSTKDDVALEGIKALAQDFTIGIGFYATCTRVKIPLAKIVGEAPPNCLAAAFADAMVEKLCQYPGSPVRAGVCDGTRTTCGSCRDGVVRIKPAIAAILKAGSK